MAFFKENEFVKLDNDVYLNVIDSGNGNRAVLGTTKVFCRFEAKGILDSDTAYNMVNNLTLWTWILWLPYRICIWL